MTPTLRHHRPPTLRLTPLGQSLAWGMILSLYFGAGMATYAVISLGGHL